MRSNSGLGSAAMKCAPAAIGSGNVTTDRRPRIAFQIRPAASSAVIENAIDEFSAVIAVRT